jgi:hypothetical protein
MEYRSPTCNCRLTPIPATIILVSYTVGREANNDVPRATDMFVRSLQSRFVRNTISGVIQR